MTDRKKPEPDLEPLAFGGMKHIARLPSMEKNPPDIAWGREFDSWPARLQLQYAKRLAAAMNHAADVLQRERNALLELCAAQEEQIAQLAEQNRLQVEMTHIQLQRVGAEKQPLYNTIVDQRSQIRTLQKRIEELDGNGDHD